MAAPWEKYQGTTESSAPWEQYGGAQSVPVKTDVAFGETGCGAATGRPMRNVQLTVQ